jgi:glycosyltransferase involved in cell wall biosynthesis
MTVSFVIPTRNQASFVRRCIDGCLAQGVAGAEILVVDGASTDGTQEILGSYGDRIRWTSEPDTGQAQAVNKGVARARGELIAWINSDDVYEGPQVLREVLATFEAAPRLDLLYGDALVVDARGEPIRPYRSREFAGAAELLASPIGPAQPATFFRRELFQRLGGLREELHWALDYDLFLRMFAAARETRYLPRPLARTTFHAGAKSTRGMLQQIREAAALKREHGARIALTTAQRARLWLGIGELYAYWALVRLGLRRVG